MNGVSPGAASHDRYCGPVREPKVILYYAFTPLADPEAIRLWQHHLCTTLGLKGRILLSPHGINGTVGGAMADVKRYVRATKEYPGFHDLDVKWSDGTGADFPRLRVRVRDEIVSFGAPDDLVVDAGGVVGGGVHLAPEAVHELLAARGDEVVFFDGRNAFEAAIGRFEGAIVPDVETTRDFVRELDSGVYDHLKDRPIVTYCTGGVRCEVLSALMTQRGFGEVYQLEGGIVRYGETYGNRGLWRGSLYIFDERMTQEFGPDTAVLGRCDRCDTPTSDYFNCANLACRALILLCGSCAQRHDATDCSERHRDAPRTSTRVTASD